MTTSQIAGRIQRKGDTLVPGKYAQMIVAGVQVGVNKSPAHYVTWIVDGKTYHNGSVAAIAIHIASQTK